MKRKNTLWSLVLALVMVLGVIAPLGALAASDAKQTDTVTLHKLMMTKEKLQAWDSAAIEKSGYNGSQDLAAFQKLDGVGTDVGEVADVYFAWQVVGKEKDGDKDQYIKGRVVNGVMTPVYKDEAKGEVEYTTNIDEAFGGKTTSTGIVFNTAKLKGNFKIQEIKEKSTYKNKGNVIVDQRAVPVEITLPLVNNDGVVAAAHVYPKNTEDKPAIDKNFAKENGLTAIKDDNKNINAGADIKNYNKEKAKAQAEVGKVIPYEVKTTIAKGTSYERLIWNDIMTNGLTFNKDVKVSAEGVNLAESDYELVQDDSGFRLKMNDSGLKKISDVTKAKTDAKDVDIILTYHATVNGTAVVDNPEKNNVTLEYGHQKGKDLVEHPVSPSNGELNVDKSFGQGAELDGLKLVYTLKENGAVKASVALDKTIVNKTIDLGNGIKFVVGAEPFKGKFTGLGTGSNWTFSERVAGYNPVYTESDAAGSVIITNNKDNDNPTPLEPKTPEVVVGGKKFVKTTEDANVKLAGAKFVVKNSEGKYLAAKSVDTVEAEQKKLADAKTKLEAAVKAYNGRKEIEDKTGLAEVNKAQEDYNKAFKTAGIRYEWKDSSNDAGVIVLASNENGQFIIEGIAYGEYKLEEIEPPKGYAKINDVDFTVAEGTKTDTNIKYDAGSEANDAKQVINKKVTIPQTGGMGTALFMVAGIALMGGAFIAMRKRSAEQA